MEKADGQKHADRGYPLYLLGTSEIPLFVRGFTMGVT
jgi:hypothetical protein